MITLDSTNKHADIVLSNGDLTAEIEAALKCFWVAFVNNSIVTANFGGSAFTYTPPSGFSAWGASTTFDSANKHANITLSGGDLTATHTTTALWQSAASTDALKSGKKYIEITLDYVDNASSIRVMIGIGPSTLSVSNYPGQTTTSYGYHAVYNGYKYNNAAGTSYGSVGVTNDIVMIAIDFDNSKIYWGLNGTWAASGDPAAGTGWGFSPFDTLVWRSVAATRALQKEKRYWEIEVDNISGDEKVFLGAGALTNLTTQYVGLQSTGHGYFLLNGYKYNNGSGIAYGNAYTAGDIIMIALDSDADKIWFGKNGTWQASGNPATAANPAYTGVTGDNGAWISLKSVSKVTMVFTAPFNYTIPSGFEEYEQPSDTRITHALVEVLRASESAAIAPTSVFFGPFFGPFEGAI